MTSVDISATSLAQAYAAAEEAKEALATMAQYIPQIFNTRGQVTGLTNPSWAYVRADETNGGASTLYFWNGSSLTRLDAGSSGGGGSAGRGISAIETDYQASASGTVTPTGAWSNIMPTVPQGEYLWARVTLTFTDATTSSFYMNARQGADGKDASQGPGKATDLGVQSGAIALDVSTGYGFVLELGGNASLTIANAPAETAVQRIALVIKSNGFTVTWPTSIFPFGATAPALSNGGKDFIALSSLDGVTWVGEHVASGFDDMTIAEDTFLGTAGTAIETRVTTTGNKQWTSSAPNMFTLDGNGALVATGNTNLANCLIDVGSKDYSVECDLTSYCSTDKTVCSLANLLVRAADFNNSWLIQLDPRSNTIEVGTRQPNENDRMIFKDTVNFVSGNSVHVRADVIDEVFTVWINGVKISSVIVTGDTTSTATKVGFYSGTNGGTSGSCKIANLKIVTFNGVKINWPVYTKQSTTPLIPVGASGAWDQTDVNNPNVFHSAILNKWVMYYSGYSNAAGAGSSAGSSGADSQVQHVGLAYADSIDGPYTKDAANPVMMALAEDGQGAFNGGMVELNGVVYQVYGSGNGAQIRMATSTDYHTWNRLGLIVAGFDAFLRVPQGTNTLEMWYGHNDGGTKRFYVMRCADPVNAPLTWVAVPGLQGIVPPTTGFLQTFLGEPSVWVPPGQEGKQYLLAFDYQQYDTNDPNPPVRRRIGQGAALFDGTNWNWNWRADASTPGQYAWENDQNFDSFMTTAPDGTLRLFNSGANVDGPSLDLNIQLEVQTAPAITSLIAS